MATITNLGSASGLPLADLLAKLQANEEKRLTLITAEQTGTQTRISAYSQLQSAVEAVQAAAAKLAAPGTLDAVKGSMSGDGVTAELGDNAVPGKYTLNVKELATSQTLKAASIADRTAAIDTGGTITIETADGKKAEITLGSDTSLNGVVKAINASDTAGVRATVVSDGNGNNYLMLTAKNTGTEGAVKSISVAGNTALADVLAYDNADAAASKLTQQQAAVNAVVEINGIEVTSATNSISSAIDGVTLNLSAKTASPVTLTLHANPAVASSAIQAFVKAYNSLQTTIKGLTAFDAKAQTSSPLTGDGTTRTIQASLANALRVSAGAGSTLHSLADMGITTNFKDGTLQLDQAKLDKALKDNPKDISALLAGPEGLAAKYDTTTKGILGNDGILKARANGLQQSLTSLQQRYDSTKETIATTVETYRLQFVKLDTLVAQLQGTSNYLSQQFEALRKSTE